MVRWEITAEQDVTHLSLRDALAIADAAGLRQALLEVVAAGRSTRVDLSAVTHIDTAAAQVLLAFGAAMRRRQLSVHWVDIPDAPREYLALAGLLDHFREEALSAEAVR